MGKINDISKKTNNRKILGNGKKPEKIFFKEKKIRNPENRKKCVKNAKNKCEHCGSDNEVSAHHIIFRGEGGDDSVRNLIALCFECHRKAHDGYYIEVSDKPAYYMTPKEFIIIVLEQVNCKKYRKTIEERLRK